MPEETSPNPPAAGRRRNAPEESSGGGSKVLVIILVLAVLGLGFALFKRSSGSGTQTEKYTTEIATLKSNAFEFSNKVVKAEFTNLVVLSNLQAVLERRTSEVMLFSNRLVQTRQQLEREEAVLLAARNEISTKATALGALEVHRDESVRQAAVIPGLELEIASLKANLNKRQFDYVALQDSFGRVSSEKAELERKLEDPLFLRRQATRVEEAAELRQRAAANQPIKYIDPRVLLALQPDGTVRPAIATSSPPRK